MLKVFTAAVIVDRGALALIAIAGGYELGTLAVGGQRADVASRSRSEGRWTVTRAATTIARATAELAITVTALAAGTPHIHTGATIGEQARTGVGRVACEPGQTIGDGGAGGEAIQVVGRAIEAVTTERTSVWAITCRAAAARQRDVTVLTAQRLAEHCRLWCIDTVSLFTAWGETLGVGTGWGLAVHRGQTLDART